MTKQSRQTAGESSNMAGPSSQTTGESRQVAGESRQVAGESNQYVDGSTQTAGESRQTARGYRTAREYRAAREAIETAGESSQPVDRTYPSDQPNMKADEDFIRIVSQVGEYANGLVHNWSAVLFCMSCRENWNATLPGLQQRWNDVLHPMILQAQADARAYPAADQANGNVGSNSFTSYIHPEYDSSDDEDPYDHSLTSYARLIIRKFPRGFEDMPPPRDPGPGEVLPSFIYVPDLASTSRAANYGYRARIIDPRGSDFDVFVDSDPGSDDNTANNNAANNGAANDDAASDVDSNTADDGSAEDDSSNDAGSAQGAGNDDGVSSLDDSEAEYNVETPSELSTDHEPTSVPDAARDDFVVNYRGRRLGTPTGQTFEREAADEDYLEDRSVRYSSSDTSSDEEGKTGKEKIQENADKVLTKNRRKAKGKAKDEGKSKLPSSTPGDVSDSSTTHEPYSTHDEYEPADEDGGESPQRPSGPYGLSDEEFSPTIRRRHRERTASLRSSPKSLAKIAEDDKNSS